MTSDDGLKWNYNIKSLAGKLDSHHHTHLHTTRVTLLQYGVVLLLA